MPSVGSSNATFPLLRLHDCGALVVWPGMQFPKVVAVKLRQNNIPNVSTSMPALRKKNACSTECLEGVERARFSMLSIWACVSIPKSRSC